MKRYFSAVFLFGLMAMLTASAFYRTNGNRETNFNRLTSFNNAKYDSADKEAIKENYGKLPLVFEENRGQTDERVKFLSRGSGYTLFLTESEAMMTFYKSSEKEGQTDTARPGKPMSRRMDFAVLKMKTVGGNLASKIVGSEEQIGKTNYFIGEDSQKWQRDVPNFAKVRYSQVYDGVDMVYYGNGRQLEYDFIVQPKSDPAQIALEFEGAKKLELGKEGDLLVHLESDFVRQQKPFVYQVINGEKKEIAGNYVLKNATQIGFEIGEYDASQPLTIDPILMYGTYLGSVQYEQSKGIAVDAAGNAYVTGYAKPPAFPTTPGSVRPTISNPFGDLLPFVSKFDATGSTLLYSTYLGGAGEGIAVDAEGNAYTTGYSYPLLFSTTPDGLNMDESVGVTKLNPQGNQRIYAARFGSSSSDYPEDIAIDSEGNAYVIGSTNCGTSPTNCDFPILNAAQPNYSGGTDIFVSKLNSTGSALVYSTYLGGSTIEQGYSIDVDTAGSAYVTGLTFSPDYPTSSGAFDNTYNCDPRYFCRPDVVAAKIAPDGSSFLYSTFLGGTGDDQGFGIAVDDGGNAYVAGYTDGRFSGFPADGFPTTTGAFKMFGSVEGFVTKLNPTGTALVYSTLLGGNDGSSCMDERARDIDVDRLGNAYVVGMTSCDSFPVVNALQSAPTNFREEAFLTKFNSNGSGLLYSTYLGGPRYDEAYHVAVDASGSAFVTGTTSGDFQLITPGAYDTSWNGANGEHPDDVFVIKVSEQSKKSKRRIVF